jgi:hypothetical protein
LVDFMLGVPDIAVSPSSFNVTARIPNVVAKTMTISNIHGSGLNWSVWNELLIPPTAVPSAAGDVKREFPTPPEITYPYGAAFDGSVLWVSQGFYGSVIYKLNPMDGSVVGSLDVGAACARPWELVWDGAKLWIASYWDNKIYAVNPSDGSKLKEFTAPDGIAPSGIAFGEGVLWVMQYYTGDTGTLYKINPDTGSVVGSVSAPAGIAGYKYSLTYFNGALWMVAYIGDGKVYKINTADGSVMKSFQGPDVYIVGLDTDNDSSLWLLSYLNKRVYLVDTGEVTWLRETPRYGTIPGLNSIQVTVSFDSEKAGLGTHEANIHVTSNDPDTPDIEIPVTFTVFDGANHDPVITDLTPAASCAVDEGSSQKFTVAAEDIDGDTLTYEWKLDNKQVGGNNEQYTYMPRYDAAGLHALIVTVTDGNGGSASQAWSITVNNVNGPPVIEELPCADPNPVKRGKETVLTVSASDPDMDDLTFTWEKLAGPGEAVFEENGTESSDMCNTTFDTAGDYEIQVTVSDGIHSTSAAVMITVDPKDSDLDTDDDDAKKSTIPGCIFSQGTDSIPACIILMFFCVCLLIYRKR